MSYFFVSFLQMGPCLCNSDACHVEGIVCVCDVCSFVDIFLNEIVYIYSVQHDDSIHRVKR